MPGHLREFCVRQASPGVFLIAQDVPVAAAIDARMLVWSASDAEEWANQLIYLPF
jgi:hypothetical protein